MITISNATKTACNSENITYKEYIVIDSTTIEIKGKMSNTAYKNGNFIGTFNLKMLEFTTENDVDFRKKEFVYYKQVNDEAFKIGTYIVTDIKESDTKEEVSITAMDYGLKFAIPYVSELNYEGGLVTLRDVLDEICTNVGVTLNNGLITNGGFTVDSNQFVNGELYGDVISYIAGITGDFATINQDDELEFIFNTTTDEVIEDYIELDDKRDTRPITIVVLGNKDIVGQEAVRIWAEGVALYGENYLRINDNLFAYTLAKREALVDAIFNKVKGFGYSAFESKYSFKPYMQLGDLVQFKNKNGDLVNSIILRIETDYDNITLSAPSIIDASVDYELTQTAYDIAKRTEIMVNQATGDITLLSEQVNENTSSIASINLDIDGIDIEVAKISPLQTQTNNLEIEVGELRSEIGDVTDITVQEEGNGTLTFETINTSEPINITIRPTADADISYLYPSSGLFPSSTTFLKVRTLRFTNTTTSEVFDYILPANLRYLNSTTYDELYLDYGTLTCRVTRKVDIDVDGVKTAKAIPVQEDYDYPNIALTAGDYTVTMLGYSNAYMKIRLMSQNMYTSQFATRVELSSAITQSADAINLEVAKKTDKTAIISTINLTSETATIDADKVDIVGVITAMNNDTTTTIDGDKITTGSITANQVSSSIITTSNLSAQNISANQITTGKISTALLNSDVITTTNFSAQNINASKITAGTLNGTVVNVTNLNASNITTGNIQSSNYVLNTSGTKISLSDGVIDTKGFKVNSTGDITATGGTIGGWTIESTQLSGGGKISGGKITGSTISGGSISITKGSYYFSMGTTTNHPSCSGLNVKSAVLIDEIELSKYSGALRIYGDLRAANIAGVSNITMSGELFCTGNIKVNTINPSGVLNISSGISINLTTPTLTIGGSTGKTGTFRYQTTLANARILEFKNGILIDEYDT